MALNVDVGIFTFCADCKRVLPNCWSTIPKTPTVAEDFCVYVSTSMLAAKLDVAVSNYYCGCKLSEKYKQLH